MRAEHPELLDLAYGPRERNRIDVFRCGRANAPLFAFIHGGYWQRNDKNMFACMAEGPLAHGFDVAMIGYTLCPDVTLTELVAETHAAIRWLRKEGPKRGFGTGKLVVSGWSAGGHLTASALPLDEVDAGLAISGIYDVEPCRLNYLNEKLKLTAEEAKAMSPILHLPKRAGPHAADGRLRHRRVAGTAAPVARLSSGAARRGPALDAVAARAAQSFLDHGRAARARRKAQRRAEQPHCRAFLNSADFPSTKAKSLERDGEE